MSSRSHLPVLARGLLGIAALLLAGALVPAQDKKEAPPKEKAAQAKQGPRQPPVVSPQIHADHRVTLRLRAPNAKEVKVTGAALQGTKPLTREQDGTWSITLGAMPPEIYTYAFVVDGVEMLDPSNTHVPVPRRSWTYSIFEIPGDPPLVHDIQDVPHGTVHLHDYRSKSLGVLRRLRVYTPPGYERDGAMRYPVLYLFHGSGGNEAQWTEVLRAHIILDNLIAQGKAKPMVIVMPDGHAPSATPQNRGGGSEAFRRDLLEDIMPLVEATYRVKPDRLHRAIAGLSMGGGQALRIGLGHLDTFAWVSAMSAAVFNPEQTLGAALNDPQLNDKLKLLWIAIGKQDGLLKQNEQMEKILQAHNIRHTYRITEGAHVMPVWRKHLAEVAPLLFVD